jgi:pSer/pThr/pTyr-binding forkhead associated (FHA) protein
VFTYKPEAQAKVGVIPSPGMESVVTTAYLTVVSISPPLQYIVAAPGEVLRLDQTFTLAPGKHILGRLRHPDVAIVIPYLYVSRRQALIEFFHPGFWEIEDLHSRNGTSVNGHMLDPHRLMPLSEGDEIRIGDVRLMFQVTPPPSRAEAYEMFLALDEFR